MSKMFVGSGDWGSGKTVFGLSYIPYGFTGKNPPKRLVIDPELRSGTYKAKDGKDNLDKLLFAFDVLNEGRLTPEIMYNFMVKVHQDKWEKNEKPDVVFIDDVANIQDIMSVWWQDGHGTQTANLYGYSKHRTVRDNKWYDPAAFNLMKKFFSEFMMDLRGQNIDLIITSPYKNVWQDYGKKGYAPDNKPWMRIIGQTANIQDCWQQYADVIWIFHRVDKQGNFLDVPEVKMDLFVRKAALPGVPEQFKWPGWVEIWKWHDERKFTADLSKLKMDEPTFSPEQITEMNNRGKMRLVNEMKDVPINIIKEIMQGEEAPPYTVDTHDEIKVYIQRIYDENYKEKSNGKNK